MDEFGKATAMLSNVPGPPSAAFLCGQELDDLMFYAFAPLGVYIGCITYNGKLTAGFCCAPDLEPQPSKIAKHWRPAFETLLAAARALPKATKTDEKELEKGGTYRLPPGWQLVTEGDGYVKVVKAPSPSSIFTRRLSAEAFPVSTPLHSKSGAPELM